MVPLANEKNLKMQKSVTFTEKSSNINALMIKIIVKLKTILIILVNTKVTHIHINIVDNLVEGVNKIKCKCGRDNKNCEPSRVKHRNCECYLEYTSVKNELIEYKCSCNKNYQKRFDENLKK